MKRGIFISVEGTDGSGKTTQINLLKESLEGRGLDVIFTREPGGTRISEMVREIVLNPENREICDTAEMLLYAAARAQHVAEVIKPALLESKIVICDRYVDSSLVYQGFGRRLGLETVELVNMIAINGLVPDITFFFDFPPEKALERRKNATGADRIEAEKLEFHSSVYEGYKKLAEMYPERIKTINSEREIDEIAKEVLQWTDKLLASRKE